MSADLDVRAWTYCNVGPVISGNLEESSIVGAGLVNVSGSVLLDGVFNVREGRVIELAYYKNGRMARLGRKLRAISSYANPVTRTTEVRVGCYLTYQANSEPPPSAVTAAEDVEGITLTGIARLVLLQPIKAKYVAKVICEKLGIEHAAIPLTNSFYKDKFELSGPYLRILSDLLISENLVGYMDATETLRFISLNDVGGRGPVLNENRIIDISPINVGEPDADVVYSIVNHKKLKVDASQDADALVTETETLEQILTRNKIEVNENTLAIIGCDLPDPPQNVITSYYVQSKNPYWLTSIDTAPPESRTFRHTETFTDYLGKKKEIITERTITYSVNSERRALYDGDGNLVEQYEENGNVWGTSSTKTYYSYSSYDDVERVTETKYEYIPGEEIVEACGFSADVLPPLPVHIKAYAPDGQVLKTQTKTVKVATPRAVVTTTTVRSAMVFTSSGKSNIQAYLNSHYDSETGRKSKSADINIPLVVKYARSTALVGTFTNYSEKAPDQSIRAVAGFDVNSGEVPLGTSSIDYDSLTEQEREDLINRALETSLSGDPNAVLANYNTANIVETVDAANASTVNVVEVPEIIYTTNTKGGIILEYTPPYLPDDGIEAVGSGCGQKYRVIPSDAAAKAKAFADRQNTLRFGYRNGQSIVFPIEYVPNRPFSPIYLNFGGVIGQYRTDRLSIAFDNTGILVSTDAIFWGGVGK